MKRDEAGGIDERSFRFYCEVLDFAESIPRGPATDRLIGQLAGAAGSITGNRDDALGASSRRGLRTCAARRLGDPSRCPRLLEEGRPLT